MQVSVETIQSLERRIIITIPGKDIAQELDKRLKPLIKTVQIAGFRHGKVPLSLIQKRFGVQIRQEIIQEFIKSSVTETLTEKQWRVVNIDTPVLDEVAGAELAEGDLRYTITCEIYPEINLTPFGEWIIHRPVLVINESDLDEMVEELRQQRQIWTTAGDRPAMIGDRITVDFNATLSDGTPFSGNSGINVVIVLGQGLFVGGFERHLVGAGAGETRIVEVTFPLGYNNPEVAGKSASFTVIVKAVENVTIPELNENFIRNCGVPEGTVEALRQLLRINLEKNFAAQTWEILKTQVLNALYQRNPLELPQGLLTSELSRLAAELPNSEAQNPALLEQAKRQIALGILVGDIARQQNIKPNSEQIRIYARSLANDNETPDDAERFYLSDNTRLQEVEAEVMSQMVVEWILGQVQIKDDPIPAKSFINPSQTG